MRFEEFAHTIGLDLAPFQRRIVKAAMGPEREFLCLLPRGQGKSTLIAAVALHHLVTTEGAAIYAAAASREQARIVFEAAAAFARVLGDEHIVDRHLELRWCPDPKSPRVFTRHLRVLAADAPRLHGLTPSMAIVDELHAHPDDSVYVALRTAAMKRPDSKLVVISTAGHGVDSPLGRLHARALAQPEVKRRGACTDARGPSLRMLEWAVADDEDVDDPKVVKKANPAPWITVDALREQREAVPDTAYRQLHANQWVAGEGHWLPPGSWQQCVGTPEFTPGERIWIGVDVGGERSATAVVWVNARLHVGCAIWTGDRGVLEAVDTIRDLAAEYDVAELVYDPWRFGQAAQEFEREGLTVVAFPQQDSRMIPASNTLHEAITERRITLPDDPELARHAADAVARHGRRGWRIDKPSPRVHVDAVIALAMAVERVMYQPEPVELLGWL